MTQQTEFQWDCYDWTNSMAMEQLLLKTMYGNGTVLTHQLYGNGLRIQCGIEIVVTQQTVWQWDFNDSTNSLAMGLLGLNTMYGNGTVMTHQLYGDVLRIQYGNNIVVTQQTVWLWDCYDWTNSMAMEQL